MRKEKVSVAMALYNGEKYMRQQIDSILVQLEPQDELILSYDESTDSTFEIAKEYEKKDSRVRVYINKVHDRGLVSNFDNALKYCTGDYIFYSDQDDYWMPDKIEKVVQAFSDSKVSVVIHDAKLSDFDLNVYEPSTFALRGGVRTSIFGNLVRLSYIGCCMAFRGELLQVVRPLPTRKRSHDWWTGSICSCYGKMLAVEEPLIIHRMHNDNATPKKRPSLVYQMSVRMIIFLQIVNRVILKRGK